MRILEPDRLKENNRAWAARMISEDPDFFRRLERQHTPHYLWIGCSDSRVPANTIVDLDPGELFVQARWSHEHWIIAVARGASHPLHRGGLHLLLGLRDLARGVDELRQDFLDALGHQEIDLQAVADELQPLHVVKERA